MLRLAEDYDTTIAQERRSQGRRFAGPDVRFGGKAATAAAAGNELNARL